MQIHPLSNINFESEKNIYVSQKTQENAQKLLSMMNKKTVYKENEQGTSFVSNILAGLSIGKKVRFSDIRYFIAPTESKVTTTADCFLSIGNKQIQFNSVTGKVFSYSIGIFSTLKGLLSDTEHYVTSLLNNFDNTDVVSRNEFGIRGFTKKGVNILNKYI